MQQNDQKRCNSKQLSVYLTNDGAILLTIRDVNAILETPLYSKHKADKRYPLHNSYDSISILNTRFEAASIEP